MKKRYDEPDLGPHYPKGEPTSRSEDASLSERIERLFRSQKYAVLATQGKEQPYASLVAFAVSDDLSQATFATPVTTRKYNLLVACDRVALFVDSRSEGDDDMMHIQAVTATGRARELERGPEWDSWFDLLIGRHPHLEAFVRSPTSALFRIDFVRFFHVTRFQEVHQWRLPRRS
jgi:nitroimidazol reductase NimA-like FMN-containing flavoprotein (pyridoxamine 5'-phosphate oxidase superfamily)